VGRGGPAGAGEAVSVQAIAVAFATKLVEEAAEAIVAAVVERRKREADESRARWERLTEEARKVEAQGGVWPQKRGGDGSDSK
jgi:hypothetical protein